MTTFVSGLTARSMPHPSGSVKRGERDGRSPRSEAEAQRPMLEETLQGLDTHRCSRH